MTLPFSFKKILIPVDLSINTEVAVKKALELAEEGTMLHLLYVMNYTLPAALGEAVCACLIQTNGAADYRMIEEKLNQWKTSIEECTNGVTVDTSISSGYTVEKAIEKKAKQLAPDLIIIGKNSHHSWLPFLNTVVPSRVTRHTGIPVLTVKPGAIHSKTRTMIVPVGSETTEYEMEIIAAICRKFRIKIHLVTFMNDGNDPSDFFASSLLQMYQWLKTSVQCPVEYAVLHGSNKAKAILNYAEKINADMLLVHPETETKIGWLDRHISDVLPPTSKIQVLAVQPTASFIQTKK